MLPTLHIKLLGDFSLVYGDELVTIVNTARLQSLLAYLVLHRDAPQPRHHLAFLLWPDSTESQARTNLRRELHHLRHALPDADCFLCADTKMVQWQPDAPFTLDVADFEAVIARADHAEEARDTPALREALEAAVACYRGDLLPSCYDEWLLLERERLRQTYIRTLERLIQLLEEQRDYRSAIRYAQRLLRHDPLHEATYRRLMRLHALNNDRASALRVYHTCTTVLQRELGVEPSLATRGAYERLLHLNAPPQAATQPATLVAAAPLVGRQPEWQHLQAAWRTTISGRAHLALVSGEAGIGKSRLAEELLQWANQQGMVTARTRCYAAEGRLAYAPVTDWLRMGNLRATLSRLEAVWLAEVARLLPELLVEQPDLPRPEPVTESWQRQRLFEALARAVLAASPPLLLVIDDLQWCDQETLEWLHYLLRFDPQARLLIVGTVRSEEIGADHPLRALLLDLRSVEQLTEIELKPLDATETASLAVQLAERDLNADLAAHLYRETEGNPLFVVETVRAGLVRGDRRAAIRNEEVVPQIQSLSSSPQSLPRKVYAVITARLAQLSPPARELVSLAATIGREFTFDVLRAACDSDENTLVRGLDELWQRHIVREQGTDAYDFSHDKIREVAYAEMSTAHRRLLHRRVAQALESVHASDLDTVSGQVAAHYERAGRPAQAIPYYQAAAEVAQRIYANQEAIAHLTKGLELLGSLPDTPKHIQQELELQIALGVALRAIKGWSTPEVEKVYARARKLCQQVGETHQLFPVLWGLCTFYIVRSELQTARELGAQCLHLAQGHNDPALLTMSHCMLGLILFHLGELTPARAHLEQSIAFYDPQQHRFHTFLYGPDLGVFCLSYASHTLWHLGYPDQALKRSREALALAQELSHPFSMAIALDYAAMFRQFRRQRHVAQDQAEAAIALCTEQGFAYYLGWGTIIQGWALAEQGELEQGMAQMHQGLDALQTAGAELRRPYYLSLLAEAYERAGEVEQGLIMLAEASSMMEKTGERFYEAELCRIRGELLRMQGAGEVEVEEHFRQALGIARRQGAKSLELRAVMSLSRLWQHQGKQGEARKMLAEIYGWFSEGFDTPDLQEARALLEAQS